MHNTARTIRIASMQAIASLLMWRALSRDYRSRSNAASLCSDNPLELPRVNRRCDKNVAENLVEGLNVCRRFLCE
jgi:hypothetical protein